MKRSLHSESPTRPSKRAKAKGKEPVRVHTLKFDAHLSDELVLTIFSYLSWSDLCRVQVTNKHWCRLASDSQLWKAIFLLEYGKPRLRGSRRFNEHPLKHIVPTHLDKGDIRDWKWMFRISLNWRRGRCMVERLETPGENSSSISELSQESYEPSHILSIGSLIITASSRPSRYTELYIHTQDSAEPIVLYGDRSGTRRNARISAITLDQSGWLSEANKCILVVVYDSGRINFFEIDIAEPSASRLTASYRAPSSEVNSPVIRVVYHRPLLVTLSETFHVALYYFADVFFAHTQTLTSYTSYPPSSLVLTKMSPEVFKLVLAYAVPVFPSHWSIAATELTITTNAILPGGGSGLSPSPPSSTGPSTSTAVSQPSHPVCVVSTSRTIRTIDFPPGWVNETQMRKMREQWHRRVDGIADTQTDGKWVVLAPQSGSSALQLYRLHFPTKKSTASPRLTFVRTLYGHTGPVTSLALADGRCVSLGLDGSLWVWDLEHGWGSEVQTPRHAAEAEESGLSSVVFDDRRIISSGPITGVEIRSFDF